jgi:hypothetical protein
MAIILSFSGVVISLLRIEPVTLDWMGILIGVLSVLVMLLIGWQIYSFIDFKESAKKMKNLTNIVEYNVEKVNLGTTMALSDYYYHIITDDRRDIVFKYLHYSVIAIMHASKIKEIDTCKAIVKGMLDVIVSPEQIQLSKYDKELIFGIISQVRHGDAIERYTELLQRLARIA